jgi:hypothetical protein
LNPLIFSPRQHYQEVSLVDQVINKSFSKPTPRLRINRIVVDEEEKVLKNHHEESIYSKMSL